MRDMNLRCYEQSTLRRLFRLLEGCVYQAILSILICVPSCVLAQTDQPSDAQHGATQQAGISGITPEMLATEAARRATMTPDELAWEETLEANLGNFYLPWYYKEKDAHHETAFDYIHDEPALPRLLILGDSISIGYTVPVRHALAGKVNVHRAPTNCGPTAKGIRDLDIWLGSGKWDVIVWNFGIHDQDTDPDLYRKNLEMLLSRLEKTGAKLVWVRSTPAPPSSPVYHDAYTDEKCTRVNRIADEVMKQNRIPEVDLYSILKPHLNEWQLPNNVHFTEAGYEVMGSEVASAVLSVLGSKE